MSLVNILTATVDQEEEEVDEKLPETNEQVPIQIKDDVTSAGVFLPPESFQQEHSFTLTEAFSKGESAAVVGTDLLNSSQINNDVSNEEEGDLSKSLSLDLDYENNDSSSTMSFDSDGLPVRRPSGRTRNTNEHSEGGISYSDDYVNSDDKTLLTSSSAYQKLQTESLMSPVHDESDDDLLEDMLGESLKAKDRYISSY